jgi:hypothetical protein
VLECFPDALKANASSVDELENELQRHAYQVFEIDEVSVDLKPIVRLDRNRTSNVVGLAQ